MGTTVLKEDILENTVQKKDMTEDIVLKKEEAEIIAQKNDKTKHITQKAEKDLKDAEMDKRKGMEALKDGPLLQCLYHPLTMTVGGLL